MSWVGGGGWFRLHNGSEGMYKRNECFLDGDRTLWTWCPQISHVHSTSRLSKWRTLSEVVYICRDSHAVLLRCGGNGRQGIHISDMKSLVAYSQHISLTVHSPSAPCFTIIQVQTEIPYSTSFLRDWKKKRKNIVLGREWLKAEWLNRVCVIIYYIPHSKR